MTTEYFEQAIGRFKEIGLLPKDFEITEIQYRKGHENFTWLAIGFSQRLEKKTLITSEDENKKAKVMVRHVYRWGYAFGALRCREGYLNEDEEGDLAVRWNEVTEKPEIVGVVGRWQSRYDLDIKEPQ